MAFPNGQVPEHLLVHENGSWFFPGTYAKFKTLRADVQHRHGVTLYVTPPAYGAGNAYRSLGGQQSIRAALGIQASIPGRSSHGGLWTGQTTGAGGLPTWVSDLEAGALDIANWAVIGWDAFKAAAERAGFITNVVVPQELWHIVDLDPWAASASGGGGAVETITNEEDEMNSTQEKKLDDALRYAKAAYERAGKAASIAQWLKGRIKGSVKQKSITTTASEARDAAQWLKGRVKGSTKNPSITAMLEAIQEAVVEGGPTTRQMIADRAAQIELTLVTDADAPVPEVDEPVEPITDEV